MSKKSRRRNKRLAALAGLLGGAMLLGRGQKPNMNIPDRNRGMMPKGIDKVIEDVVVPKNIINPNMNRSINTNLGRMTGSGPTKGEIGQDIRANYARKMRNIAADRNRNNMLLL